MLRSVLLPFPYRFWREADAKLSFLLGPSRWAKTKRTLVPIILIVGSGLLYGGQLGAALLGGLIGLVAGLILIAISWPWLDRIIAGGLIGFMLCDLAAGQWHLVATIQGIISIGGAAIGAILGATIFTKSHMSEN